MEKKETTYNIDVVKKKTVIKAPRGVSLKLPSYIYPIISILLIFGLWYSAILLFNIPEYLVPTPLEVLKEMWAQKTLLLQHMAPTLIEIIVGFILAVIIAFPLAILIASSSMMDRIINPILTAIQVMPTVAVAPLLVVWFGYGILPKVFTVFLMSFFPILINAISGLRSTEVELVYLLKTMGASRLELFMKVRIPQALPQMFAGLKVAMTLAIVGSIVGEFVGANEGLGYLLQMANAQLNTKMIFGNLITLCILGIALFKFMEWLERKSLPWHVSFRRK